ncbi:MAG: DUF4349 domain-containing protein [Acidimicrobiales bacterium]
MRAKQVIGVVVSAAALIGLLGACSEVGDDNSAKTAGDASAGSGSDALAAELNKGPAAGSQIEDREIVYTGSITLRVRDVEEAADEARSIADAAGGFVSAQVSQLEGDREITITLRVPADRFEAVATKAAALGVVKARTVDSDDVTDQVVDLKGRLENAEASAKRLRELLAQAEVLDNVVTLEERLAQRESDIEQLMGQLEVLQDRVELATLDLTLSEKDAPEVSDDLPGPLDALRTGAVTVGNLGLLLLAAVAFLVPFSPFLLAGWWLWRRTKPRREARRAARRAALPAPAVGWPAAPPPAAMAPAVQQARGASPTDDAEPAPEG